MSRNNIFNGRNGPMAHHALIHHFQIAFAGIAAFHPMGFVIIDCEMSYFGVPCVFAEGTAQPVENPFGIAKRTGQEPPAVILGKPGECRF